MREDLERENDVICKELAPPYDICYIPEPQCIPVSEGLPDDGQEVYIIRESGVRQIVDFIKYDGNWVEWTIHSDGESITLDTDNDPVVSWRPMEPLPAKPEEER